MGRPPRLHIPGSIHHVFSRGNGGKDIFADALDYQRFLDELSQLRALGLTFFAYCLMPTHFHLLVRVAERSLSQLMQLCLGRYSQYFNFRRGTFGNVFQARFKDSLIDTNEYLLAAIRYIHMNPVDARLVESPDEWRWSGHRGVLGSPDQLLVPEVVLALFSEDDARARKMYQEFVCVRTQKPVSEPVGSPAVSRNLEVIAADCAGAFLIAAEQIRSGTQVRAVVRGRRLFVRRSLDCGFQPREIAKFLGCDPSAISKMIRAGSFNESFNSRPDTSFIIRP